MAKRLEIVEWPHPALTTIAEPVTEFNKDLAVLAADMHHTMRKADGVGLAANQVNILKRIFVIDLMGYKLTFVNPEIIEASGIDSKVEGCLSFPNIARIVDRAQAVRIRAQQLDGKPFEIRVTGLLAICCQHELDHLNGIVFTQKDGEH